MKQPPKKRAGIPTGRRTRNGLELDPATAAERLGVSVKSVRADIARGLLPYRKHGGRVVILADELEEFLRRLPGVTVEQALAHLAVRNGGA